MTTQAKFHGIASQLSLPWFFDRFSDKHLILKTDSASKIDSAGILAGVVGRALVFFPPGLVRFLFIDPVGLGKSFASFHALADYDDKVITGQVWSDPRHIRDELAKVVQHLERVVQKYLRADYESIDDYNRKAGQIAEPYRFIVINGFPEGFDSEACLSLERIISNGPKCGVHVVLLWDTAKQLPHSVTERRIIQDVNTLTIGKDGELTYATPSDLQRRAHLFLDEAPTESGIKSIVVSHGKHAKEGARVEVPFSQMMKKVRAGAPFGIDGTKEPWSLDSTNGLVVPLGPTAAMKYQYMTLGESGSTAVHAMLVGRPGSGKSNLQHVIVSGIAELYRPNEVRLYLIDLKEGVEFKRYVNNLLPHAAVVAVNGDKEFALSVLRRLDNVQKELGVLFKNTVLNGNPVQNFADYRKATGKIIPRHFLIIDEFQELLNDDGAIAREASALLERIGRQGRAFGIHMLLATQSLQGVRLPKQVMSQIAVRIAMQCSDSDSRLVLAEDNPGARLLDRAGEAIYNAKEGLNEANSRFQTALLSSDESSVFMQGVHERFRNLPEDVRSSIDPTFIFDGNEPAKFENCHEYRDAVAAKSPPSKGAINLWVGEPIGMEPAHAVEMKRQSGSHLMVIQREEALGFGVVFGAVLSALAQRDADRVRVEFVDLSSADADWADYPEAIEQVLPNSCRVYGRREMLQVIADLAASVKAAEGSGVKDLPSTYLVIFGLHRARDLRREAKSIGFGRETSGPSVQENLATILKEGAEVGVHVLLWCDTYQNLANALDPAAVAEIGKRVVGSLSSNDSSRLLDDPVASKITKEYRMIAYDDEKVGIFKHIRPFLPPSPDWLLATLQTLAARKLQNNTEVPS